MTIHVLIDLSILDILNHEKYTWSCYFDAHSSTVKSLRGTTRRRCHFTVLVMGILLRRLRMLRPQNDNCQRHVSNNQQDEHDLILLNPNALVLKKCHFFATDLWVPFPNYVALHFAPQVGVSLKLGHTPLMHPNAYSIYLGESNDNPLEFRVTPW